MLSFVLGKRKVKSDSMSTGNFIIYISAWWSQIFYLIIYLICSSSCNNFVQGFFDISFLLLRTLMLQQYMMVWLIISQLKFCLLMYLGFSQVESKEKLLLPYTLLREQILTKNNFQVSRIWRLKWENIMMMAKMEICPQVKVNQQFCKVLEIPVVISQAMMRPTEFYLGQVLPL